MSHIKCKYGEIDMDKNYNYWYGLENGFNIYGWNYIRDYRFEPEDNLTVGFINHCDDHGIKIDYCLSIQKVICSNISIEDALRELVNSLNSNYIVLIPVSTDIGKILEGVGFKPIDFIDTYDGTVVYMYMNEFAKQVTTKLESAQCKSFRFGSYRLSFKGTSFENGKYTNEEVKIMSPFLSKIVQYCIDNNIGIGNCYDITEIGYFPNGFENINLAFKELAYWCGKDNNIIILTTNMDLDGPISGFRKYSMPFDCFMYIHINEFTDELLSKHFDEIFHSFNGMTYTVEYEMEVNTGEEE